MKEVYIRVDGNNAIGYGHLFRCIALAEMLKEQFKVIFIIKDSNDFAISQINKTTGKIIQLGKVDLNEESTFLSNFFLKKNVILVLDGYQYTFEYQLTIKKSGVKIVYIDDLHSIHMCADIVLNQAFGVLKEKYSFEPYTRFCLGTEWIIQRPSFTKASIQNREIYNVKSAFITIGGGPIFNIANKILLALDNLSEIKRIVFLKGNEDVFEQDVKPFLNDKIEVFEKLNDQELCDILMKCDIAVCPSSVISLEACSVGIGLFAGYTVDNQIDTYSGIVENNLAFGLGDLRTASIPNIEASIKRKLDIVIINAQIKNQKRIFDGKSKSKFIDLFKSL